MCRRGGLRRGRRGGRLSWRGRGCCREGESGLGICYVRFGTEIGNGMEFGALGIRNERCGNLGDHLSSFHSC